MSTDITPKFATWSVNIRRSVTTRLGASDLALSAGGVTFYAAVAVVPILLLTIKGTAVVTSEDWVVARFTDVTLLLPDALGAREVVMTLAHAGVALSWLGVLLAVFPSTFYGEGLRRALLVYRPTEESFTGWRGRALTAPFVLFAPVLLTAMLATGEFLARHTTSGGAGRVMLRIFLGFNVTWLVLAVVIGWVFAAIGPTRVGASALLAGSLVTASFVGGFVQGFVLFLAIPVDVGAPFGDLVVIGGVVAAGLWMFLLHVLLLFGWALTLAFDEHGWWPRSSTS